MHVPGKRDAAGLFPGVLRGGFPWACPILFLLLSEPFWPGAYCNVSDPIGTGFKLDCSKKPFFLGQAWAPTRLTACLQCQRRAKPWLCGGGAAWEDWVDGGWGMWCFQGTVAAGCCCVSAGSRVLAEPSMGQAGDVLVPGKPPNRAGGDGPGILLPVTPIPPCPCGAWLPRGQAIPPPNPWGIPQPPKGRTLGRFPVETKLP